MHRLLARLAVFALACPLLACALLMLAAPAHAQAPTITGFSPASGPVGTTVVITGTNFNGTNVVGFQNQHATSFTVNSSTQITTSVPNGAATGPVAVATPGGTAHSSTNFTVTVPAPTITSFTPASGPVGTSVTLTGTNFTGASTVAFNGTAATTFSVVSATSITATVPTGATTGTIAVTTPGGAATSSGTFTVTVPAPTITGFSPTSGPVGTSVVITGTSFTGTTVVGFQNQHATSFTVNSPTQITTIVPSGAATGPIAVATPGGTAHSSTNFTVTTGGSAPTVTSFTPAGGPAGATVTLTGTNFTGATAIAFNGAAAATFTVASATSITAVAPAGATSGSITVTTPSGSATTTGSFVVYPQVNAGGVGLTASGQTSGGVIAWAADNGSPSLTTARTLATTATSFPGSNQTTLPYQLFQNERLSDGTGTVSEGGTGFSFTESNTANGMYTLNLYFAETNKNFVAGSRVFNVYVNGQLAVSNFDIYHQAIAHGATMTTAINTVVTESLPITVTGGQFVLDFQDVTKPTSPTLAGAVLGAFNLSAPASPAPDVPAPGWGGDVLPSDDGTGAEGAGPGASLGVSMPSLVEEIQPGPDLSAYNPLGPSVSYERMFRGNRAQTGYASPGLSAGWTDNYDLSIVPIVNPQTMAVTGYNLTYPNGAVDAWALSGSAITPPSGAPYLATIVNAGTITMEFKDRSVYTFSQITAASANYAAGTYLFSKITNLVGRSVTISRAAAASNYRVAYLANDSSAKLLAFNYNASGQLSTLQDVASPNSADYREVEYNFSGTPSLLQDVTTIQPYNTPFTNRNDQWLYLYQTIGGFNYISSVKGPDPQTYTLASPTFVAATTTLGTTGSMTGLVQAFTDANSAKRTYQPRIDGTQVSVYTNKADASPVQQWAQLALIGSSAKNVDGGMQDASGNRSSLAYVSPGGSYSPSPSPYLPSLGTDRNGHIVDLTYDTSNAYGNILTAADSRGTTMTYTYDPTFPLGQVLTAQETHVSIQNNMPVTDMTRTETTYKYYPSGSGVKTGLLMEVDTPTPGDYADTSQQVATTYTYTGSGTGSLGDIATITTPGLTGITPGSSPQTAITYATLTTTFAYAAPEAVGEPISVTDAAGDETQYHYDGRGNCTAVIDASNYETDYAYNIANQVIAVMYPTTTSGKTGAYVYYSYEYPGGPLASVALYPEGTAYPPVSATPDRMTTYTYDHEGQTLTVADLFGQVATYAYDGMGRVVSVTDSGTSKTPGTSHTTKYTYNPDGSLALVQYPNAAGTGSGASDTETYTYDADQNVIGEVDGRGVTTTYARMDPESLVTGVSYTLPMSHPGITGINPVSYVYDGFGRRMTMTDGTGSTEYVYDDLDAPISVTTSFTGGPQNQTIAYAYNPDGSRFSMTTPLDNQTGMAGIQTQGTNWYYDQAQRVTQILFPWSSDGGTATSKFGVAAYAYYPNSWLKTTSLAQADPTLDDLIDIGATYNPRGFLTDMKATYATSSGYYNTGTASPLLNEFSTPSSSYDSSGNRLALLATIPENGGYSDAVSQPNVDLNDIPDASRSLTYAYDSRDELTLDKGTLAGQDKTDNYHNVHNFPFSYDTAYNPTTFRGTGTDAVTNDEQLSAFYGMTGSSLGAFSFDGAGSPTTYQSQSLTFDPEDRLASAQGDTFAYDGDGKRATKTANGVTTYYLYDGGQVINEETDADPQNPVVFAYGWGVDGIRARYCFPGDTNADLPADSTLAYLYDPSGNTAQRMELVYDNDPAQAEGLYVQVRDYQVFDAYGALSGRIDTVTYPSVPMDRDPVGFGGQEGYYTDVETGLCLLGARYYDASVGRFLNRDPTGYDGGINLYGFCGNNPVMESDPSGLHDGGESGTDITAPNAAGIMRYNAAKAAADSARATAQEKEDLALAHKLRDAMILLTPVYGPHGGEEDAASVAEDEDVVVAETTAVDTEAEAESLLQQIQDDALGQHFYSRHGAQTTLEQQYTRSITGLTPDGFQGNSVDSSRFLTHEDQVLAIERANQIHAQTNAPTISFNMGRVIGEGYTRNGTEWVRTTNVTAFFRNGSVHTIFPRLRPLP